MLDINFRCPEVNTVKLSKRASKSYRTIIYHFELDILWITIYEEYLGKRRLKVMFIYYLSEVDSFTVYLHTQGIGLLNLW